MTIGNLKRFATVACIALGVSLSGVAFADHGEMNEREQAEAERMERDYNMPNAHCQEIVGSDGKTHMVCHGEGFEEPKKVPE